MIGSSINMALLYFCLICWAVIFITKLRFPPTTIQIKNTLMCTFTSVLEYCHNICLACATLRTLTMSRTCRSVMYYLRRKFGGFVALSFDLTYLILQFDISFSEKIRQNIRNILGGINLVNPRYMSC